MRRDRLARPVRRPHPLLRFRLTHRLPLTATSPTAWQSLAAELEAALRPRGFDLVAPLQVRWYNAEVAPTYRLPDLGRADALAIVVGNSRALWPAVRAAVAADPDGLARDPVDRYTERVVTAAVVGLAQPHAIRWAAVDAPEPIAIQRMAAVAGLAHVTASRLAVHPVFGPWIALRAAIVLDAPGPAERPAPLPAPCDCERHCAAALSRALASGGDWQAWLAVRDACPVGRAHRYSDEQIRYHGTKDPSLLGRPGITPAATDPPDDG